jgi:hypothetical protein
LALLFWACVYNTVGTHGGAKPFDSWWEVVDRKRKGVGSHCLVKGMSQRTRRPPRRPRLLKVPPPLNSVILGNTPFTHGPLGDIPDPNYSRSQITKTALKPESHKELDLNTIESESQDVSLSGSWCH